MKSSNKYPSLFTFFLLSILFFGGFFLVFPNKETSGETDAVAIRVIPNPNHYSPSLWFERQGFSGPKQSLLVDGYEAIRSGTTVYVNVANVVDTNNDNIIDTLFTNIYMISSTEDSTRDTQEIFSQILNNWKFNTNINPVGSCNKEIEKACVYDGDCKTEDYCTGKKARIIRDVKRLSDAVLIKEALEEYKQKNNHYPILAAGSYLPNVSLSVWPSWSEAFSKELAKTIAKDPLNILGDCPGYNEKTCWNEVSKEFVTDIKAGIIPVSSHVYLYLTDPKGASYDYCFTTDSGYIDENNGACLGPGSFGFGGEAGNRQPVFDGKNLSTAYSGYSYSGYIQAFDADGDDLTWTIDTTLSSWDGWSAPVQIKNTSIQNQKEIYADAVGPDGEHSFSLTINDGRGEPNSITTSIFKILVGNIPPEITFSDYTYIASSTNPLAYSLTAFDSGPGNMPLTYSLISGALFPGVVGSFDGSMARYEMNGAITPGFSIPNTFTFPYVIRLTDAFGASSDAEFSIKVINNKPIFISANCNDPIRTGQTLTCTLKASDPEANFLKYSVTFTSSGVLSVNSSTGVVNITNLLNHGNHYFNYKIEDEYGASITGRRNFTVNTFCGDGIKQSPNTEGRGGIGDSGQEQCDGVAGVATSPLTSSATFQYGCNSDCLALLGGWCGDGVRNGSEQCDGLDGSFATIPETSTSAFQSACADDCTATAGGWCGDGIVNGSEICEPGQVQECASDFTVGLPSHCSGVSVSGTQVCNNTCTGWGSCSAGAPSIVGNSATDCDTTSPTMNDYSCCTLINCVQDECTCCGRVEGSPIPVAYTALQGLVSVWDSSFVTNEPGANSCFIGPFTGTYNCRVTQSNINPRNWTITTNHSTAYFQCWE